MLQMQHQISHLLLLLQGMLLMLLQGMPDLLRQ
jgi:hypothetical protein